MESFKGSATVKLRNSLRVLAQRPDQVVVLKATPEILLLRPRKTGVQSRLVDRKQTAGFLAYCRAILDGHAHPADVAYDIAVKEATAQAHFTKLSKSIETVRSGMVKLIQGYPADELKRLRLREVISDAFQDRIINDILALTARTFRDAGLGLPLATDAAYSFQFRHALCSYVLVLNWAANSGYQTVAADRLRNDFIDAVYAAYATFFDGLITQDKKLFDVYRGAKWLLPNVFGVPQS